LDDYFLDQTLEGNWDDHDFGDISSSTFLQVPALREAFTYIASGN
jgi:hypothetical protein